MTHACISNGPHESDAYSHDDVPDRAPARQMNNHPNHDADPDRDDEEE